MYYPDETFSVVRKGFNFRIRFLCGLSVCRLSDRDKFRIFANKKKRMIQIDDVVVTLDLFKEKFCCDLEACKGSCCIEGDAGAPLEEEEVLALEEALPVIEDQLAPEAREVIARQGVCYVDEEGDLVTSIVNGKDCVFTCYDERGCCYCALERAYREGKVAFQKPVSCFLYPARVKEYKDFRVLNYHRWDVCKSAVVCGRKENLPLYRFLKEPLVRKFGKVWYKELESVAIELRKQGYLKE